MRVQLVVQAFVVMDKAPGLMICGWPSEESWLTIFNHEVNGDFQLTLGECKSVVSKCETQKAACRLRKEKDTNFNWKNTF